MKLRLVKDWKKAHKWLSVKAMFVAMALQGAWAGMPSDLKSSLPEWVAPVAAVVILACGLAGRLVEQDDA